MCLYTTSKYDDLGFFIKLIVIIVDIDSAKETNQNKQNKALPQEPERTGFELLLYHLYPEHFTWPL